MNDRMKQEMRNHILSYFKQMPGLRENCCYPTRILYQKLMHLSDPEKEALLLAANELEEEGYITITDSDLTRTKFLITEKGVEHIINEKYTEKPEKLNSAEIHIGTIHTHNSQIGNHNTIKSINTKDEIQVLKTLLDLSPEQKKLVFNKLISLESTDKTIEEVFLELNKLITK